MVLHLLTQIIGLQYLTDATESVKHDIIAVILFSVIKCIRQLAKQLTQVVVSNILNESDGVPKVSNLGHGNRTIISFPGSQKPLRGRICVTSLGNDIKAHRSVLSSPVDGINWLQDLDASFLVFLLNLSMNLYWSEGESGCSLSGST